MTIHGAGFDPLTIDWADFGDPSRESSVDTNYVFLTGTEMQIVAPTESLSVGKLGVPLSVKTDAGQSRPATVTYAGVPVVTAVLNTTNSTELDGTYGAPDTGRTPIQVSGQGFSGQLIAPIEFSDTQTSYSLGTQYTFTVESDTSLNTQTVQQNPALVDVQLCTVTACSLNRPADLLYLYPPGNPSVTSVKPTSGPARGGTKATIAGDNLGCALDVYFGNVQAESITPVKAILDCGDPQLRVDHRAGRNLSAWRGSHHGAREREHCGELLHRIRARLDNCELPLHIALVKRHWRRQTSMASIWLTLLCSAVILAVASETDSRIAASRALEGNSSAARMLPAAKTRADPRNTLA